MKLSEYFEKTAGRGVLATSDVHGAVNVAIYARPHFVDEETVAFIMADRLTHKYLQSNPRAAYLFMESGEKYVGKRLYLTKIKEEENPALIDKMRRRKAYSAPAEDRTEKKYLVYFYIEKILPLIATHDS